MDKTNLKKIAAALLALLLLIPAAACGRGGRLSYEERKQRDEELYGAVDLGGINDANALFDTPSPNFTLPYSRTGMSQVDLDPFTCTSTLNDALCHLVYDRLVYIDSEFHIVEAIAQSAEMTTNKMITVILRGIVFSDGSLLTGEDVVYSFEQAKTSLKYKAQLDNFTSCATGETATNIVVFRLEEPDIMAVMNLDFPIIKKFSDRNDPERPSTDPQNAHMPVGSGRYYYYSDIEHGFFLMRNKRWYGKNPTPIDGKKPSPIERISLVGMPSMESIIHSIEIGTVSYYFADLREGFLFKDSSDRPSNRFGGNYVTVDLNNLVFLGLNTFDTRLQSREVRAAISFALNRDDICSNVYGGRAYGATGPFTTSWPEAAEVQYGSTLDDQSRFLTSLQTSGYMNRSEAGIRYDNQGRFLNFELLVNATNAQHIAAANAVAMQLGKAGIGVNVVHLGRDEMAGRISRGEYQIYFGEYSLTNNMDVSRLFTPGSGLYSGPSPETTVIAFGGYRAGDVSLEDFVDAFDSDIPFIPLCYRLGMVCYTRGISANMNVSVSNLFSDMETWEILEPVTDSDAPADETAA